MIALIDKTTRKIVVLIDSKNELDNPKWSVLQSVEVAEVKKCEHCYGGWVVEERKEEGNE